MPETTAKIICRQSRGNKFTIPILLNLLEKAGFDQKAAIEVVTSLPALKKSCASARKALLIYSFMTPHIPEVWKEIRALKQIFPKHLVFLAGGPHPTGAPQETLAMGFDTVISGPGESCLAATVQTLLEDAGSLKGKIIRADPAVCLDEALPVSRLIPFIPPLEIMRGCCHRCAFCQTGHSQKPVFRSLDSVSGYIDILIQRDLLQRNGFICPSGLEYGAEKGQINPDKIETLLDMSKTAGIRYLEYGIFPSEIHPRTLNEAALRLILKYCSNKKLTIGAQSGSNVILKRIRRGHTIEDVETAAALACAHGFRPILDFIIGFPGETEADRMQTLHWVKKLHARYQARIQMHYFIPLAGTALYDAMPALPDQNTRKILDACSRGGVCTDWWRTGFEISWELIRTREKINPDYSSVF